MYHAQYLFYGEPVLAQAACKCLHVCIIPLHACAFIGYWNHEWSLHGFAVYQATSAIWGVLHGIAGCQATSAMGGGRHSAFVPF